VHRALLQVWWRTQLVRDCRMFGGDKIGPRVLQINPRSSTVPPWPSATSFGDDPKGAKWTNHRIVGAGELHVQMHVGASGSDNSAKVPAAVVPVRTGAGERIAKIGSRMKMRRRSQSWLVTSIQRAHKAVEDSGCGAYAASSDWAQSLVDSDRPSPCDGTSWAESLSRPRHGRCAYNCHRRSFRSPLG